MKVDKERLCGLPNDGRSNDLQIEAIYDFRNNPNAKPVHAESYLNVLSDPDWADLRKQATKSRNTQNPVLRCGDCRKAVYARESPQGRRHCYHFSGDHRDCRWSSAVGRRIRSIDAEKFHGLQEGERHKELCRLVSEVLAIDEKARNSGIEINQYTKAENGQYAYPDVLTGQWQGLPAAFEIQLSTTHMPVITRREEFYEGAQTRLIWIVGDRAESFSKRTFKDIYMRNDAQILGMDREVANKAKKAGEPMFRLHRLLPGAARDGFAAQWRERIVRANEIDWGDVVRKPRSAGFSYDRYLDQKIMRDPILALSREKFYAALADENMQSAKENWNYAANIVGGTSWDDLPTPHQACRALGVLATLRTGKLCIYSKLRPDQHVQLANSMLLEPDERRCWTRAFRRLCQSLGFTELLSQKHVQIKCTRNEDELAAEMPVDQQIGAVFNVMFPEGAFDRLMLDSDATGD